MFLQTGTLCAAGEVSGGQPSPPPSMSAPLTRTSAASTSRREFFKRAGFGLGAVAVASTLAACDSDDPVDGDVVTLDFSSDVGVLNYAYALEQLEAGFYATVVANAAFSSAFSTDEQAILRDIAAHEGIHRDFFAAAIAGAGATAIPALTPNFDSVDFSSRSNVLAVAQTFEDLGVAAYNGAGQYIQSADYLLIAGKIVSVEARHASVIAGLITPNTIAASGVVDSDGLDRALRPDAVLSAAAPFLRDSIRAINVPTA